MNGIHKIWKWTNEMLKCSVSSWQAVSVDVRWCPPVLRSVLVHEGYPGRHKQIWACMHIWWVVAVALMCTTYHVIWCGWDKRIAMSGHGSICVATMVKHLWSELIYGIDDMVTRSWLSVLLLMMTRCMMSLQCIDNYLCLHKHWTWRWVYIDGLYSNTCMQMYCMASYL